jgi:hypothetical protein
MAERATVVLPLARGAAAAVAAPRLGGVAGV